MRKFLEHNRYSIVKYLVMVAGTVVVNKVSHEVANQVWKRTLPYFSDSE